VIRAAALRAWLTLAASAAHAQTPLVPLPADVTVTAAGADVSPDMAPFSGAWGPGVWDGDLPHALVVERIDPDGLTVVVYAVGEYEEWKARARAMRVIGRIDRRRPPARTVHLRRDHRVRRAAAHHARRSRQRAGAPGAATGNGAGLGLTPAR
jgi:hypothetical protein